MWDGASRPRVADRLRQVKQGYFGLNKASLLVFQRTCKAPGLLFQTKLVFNHPAVAYTTWMPQASIEDP